MAAEYALADLIVDMRRIVGEAGTAADIVRELTGPARRLALAEAWFESRFFRGNGESGFEIFPLYEEPDHSLSVVVASLSAGRSLPPHNHRTWAVQAGIRGVETNVSWRRLDDGTRRGYAVLAESGRTTFGPGDVVTFLPDDIHSVRNESDQLALSLNLYGLSYAYAGASKFDPIAKTEEPLIPDGVAPKADSVPAGGDHSSQGRGPR